MQAKSTQQMLAESSTVFVGCLGCTRSRPHVHQDIPSSFASDFASFCAASSVVSELHRSPQDGCLFGVLRQCLCFCVFLVCRSLHFYLSVQNCTLNLCFSCSESEVHPLPLLTFSFFWEGGLGLKHNTPEVSRKCVCFSPLSSVPAWPTSAVRPPLLFILSLQACLEQPKAGQLLRDGLLCTGWMTRWLPLCVDVQMTGGLDVSKQRRQAFCKIRKRGRKKNMKCI